MGRRLPLTLCAILLAALAATRFQPAPAAPRGEERWLDYHDDSPDGRIVARLRVAVLSEASGRGQLVIEPHARGPNVAPVRGFRGVAGVNVRTARELDALAREARIELVTRPLGRSGAPRSGSITLGTRRRLPMRTLAPDGRLDLAARTPDAPPTSLCLTTPRLDPGRWTSEVHADGDVRLAVDFVLEREGARILAVRGAGPSDVRARPLP